MTSYSRHFDPTQPDWNQVEATQVNGMVSLSKDSKEALLPSSNGIICLTAYDFGVRIRIGNKPTANYPILVDEPNALPWVVLKRDESSSVLQCNDFELVIQHSPFTFILTRNGKVIQQTSDDGHFVRQYRLPPLAKVNQGWLLSMQLDHDEPVFGLGEKWGKLDKRGQFIRSYNHDALGVNGEISYKNTPFCWSPNGWGAFVHTPAPVTHAVGYAPWSQRSYSLLVEDQYLDIFLFAQANGKDMLKAYCDLTGYAPTPPLWSLGVILSKAYYSDVPELLQTAQAVRDNKMPCDVITLDGRAWQDTDTRFAFEWDPKRFDNPAATIQSLKAQNFKVCVWEYPLVSLENPLFAEMERKGWLLKDKRTGGTYRYQWDMSAFADVLTPLPESGIVDFTHPDAYQFWLESHQALFDLGVDMIKADFGEQVEDDNMLAHNGDSGHRLHNAYSLLYNQCVYEAAKRYCKTGPFLFSRSSWTGCQRFPSQWGGDPQADWGGLAGSIRGALSWGMSGAPFYATDVGGFYKDTRDAELFVRWTQAAVFSAHMRLHGIGQREPWSYGEVANASASKALSLRYQLIPYIRRAMQQANETGLPLMRGMALAFPEDKLSWAFELQFMFGDDLLVVPCMQPGGLVEFYLPKGDWVQFMTSNEFDGGKLHSMTLGIDEMAVFVLKGKSIPLGADAQHTDELDEHTLITHHWQAS